MLYCANILMGDNSLLRCSIVILCVILVISTSRCSIISAPLGTKAVLNCRVDGVPLDSSTMVTWMNPRGEGMSINEKTMTSSDPRFTINKPYHTEFNLHISNVKMSDQGNYTCNAFKGGNQFFNSHVVLNILVPPKARAPHNTNISVVEGGQVILECQGEGIPKPELDWKYHRKDSSVEETIAMDEPSRYVIKNITLKQSGHYECQANNNVPPISSVHYYVEVLSAPIIHVPYMKIMQKVSNYIFLQCIITWNPIGHFHWEHEGRRLSDSKETKSILTKYIHSTHQIDSHSWSVGLFVFHFDIADGGLYKCHANNKYGITHGSIKVAAYQAVDGSDDPQRVYADPGSDVILHCEEKDVKILWSKHTVALKDFEVISMSGKYQLTKERNLKITSVNKLDQGYYICSNRSNSSIYLSIADAEASTSCEQRSINLPITLGIVAATTLILSSIFVTILLVMRSRHRKRFNTSGESILTGKRSIAPIKL